MLELMTGDHSVYMMCSAYQDVHNNPKHVQKNGEADRPRYLGEFGASNFKVVTVTLKFFLKCNCYLEEFFKSVTVTLKKKFKV